MKLHKKDIIVLSIILVIAFFVSIWIGEDLVYWPLLLMVSITSPVFWLIFLFCIVLWFFWGKRRKSMINFFVYFLLFITFIFTGYYMGVKISQNAYNECVEKGEFLREKLQDFRDDKGKYPKALDELEISNLPGSRLLRGNILEYNSDGNSYSITFRDWLVSHEATEKFEFSARK